MGGDAMERSQGEGPAGGESGHSAGNAHDDQTFDAIVDAMSADDAPTAMDLAIAAWLHVKEQRSQSAKTLASYGPTIHAFRALLREQGLDLDDADPRVARRRLRAALGARPAQRVGDAAGDRDPAPSAEAVEDLVAARAATIALLAQTFAARPRLTRDGPRPVAASTTNLRLATLSSFYAYALNQ